MNNDVTHYVGEGSDQDYDIEHDSLFLYTKGMKYQFSIETPNILIDIDQNNNIMGVEILRASKTFGVKKSDIKNNIGMQFNANITHDKIEAQLVIFVLEKKVKVEKVYTVSVPNEWNLQETSNMALTA